MSRIYVSGPVTGMKCNNIVAFAVEATALEKVGHETTVPHEIVPADATREQAMLLCVNELTTVGDAGGHYEPIYDGMALLEGWEQSEGARLEKAVAEACGIPVKTVEEWLEEAR